MNNNWKLASNPPKEDEFVLLNFEFGGLHNVSIGYFVAPNRWFEVRGESSLEADASPLHWIEIPELPKNKL